MKIIRLVSDVLTKSIFQKSTSAPIMIKPNSSIALKSLSFELKHDLGFQIDSDDYIMSFSTDGKNYVTLLIPRGKYDRTTFLDSILRNLNGSMMTENPTENGTEWNIITTADDKVNISFGRSDYGLVSDFNLLNVTQDQNVYNKTVVSEVIDSWAQCKSFICRGGLQNKITIAGTSTANNEFYYGLCDQLFDTTKKTTLTIDDFQCCIFTTRANKNYNFKSIDGTTVESNTPWDVNDTIVMKKITINNSLNFQFIVLKQNIEYILGQFIMTGDFILSQLFQTFAFGNAEDTFNMVNPSQITSPYCQSSTDGKYIQLETLPIVYADNNLTATQINASIYFDTSIMQSFMGYDTNKLKVNGISGNFQAKNIFGLPLTFQSGDDLVVELPNLNIDGYDFLENKKSSIVAIIPIESLTKNVFGYSYIEPFPTFLSLNNDQLTNINTFYVSIKSGGQLLDVTDKIFIQLLINH